jgi:hypothetical protein
MSEEIMIKQSEAVKTVKLRHEEATDRFTEVINEVLENIPEVRSVALVIDWAVGQELFPYGIMIGRRGSVNRPDELYSLMIQTAKLVRHQSDVMAGILAGMDKLASDLASQITKLKKELNNSEAQLEAMKGKV